MIINFRHGLVNAPFNNLTNQPSFLVSRTSSINIVTPSPVQLAFAHGNTNYLVSIDQPVTPAWAGFGSPAFPNGVDYYLYVDIHPTTGVITYGQSKYDLVAQPTAPRSPGVSQHWFDTTNYKTKVWSGTSWIEKIRLFVAKYVNRSTFTYKPIGTQVGISGVEAATGKIVFDGFGRPLRKSNGEFFTTEDQINVAGTTSSSNALTSRILTVTAVEPIPENSVVKFVEFGRVALADYEDCDKFQLAFANNSAPTEGTLNVLTTGVIEVPAWNWTKVNRHVWVDVNGKLTTTDPASGTSGRGMQYPVGRVIESNMISFAPILSGSPLGGVESTPSSLPDTIVKRDGNANFAVNAIFVNEVNSTSDSKLKTNVAPIPNALDVICQLNPVIYNMIATGNLSSGLIAQELQQILPHLVSEIDDGNGQSHLTINYIPLIAYLIAAIQELSQRK